MLKPVCVEREITNDILTSILGIPTKLSAQLMAAILQLIPVGVKALHQAIYINRIGQIILSIPGSQHMFHLDGG